MTIFFAAVNTLFTLARAGTRIITGSDELEQRERAPENRLFVRVLCLFFKGVFDKKQLQNHANRSKNACRVDILFTFFKWILIQKSAH